MIVYFVNIKKIDKHLNKQTASLRAHVSDNMHGFINLVKMKTVYLTATVTIIFVLFYLNNTTYIVKFKVRSRINTTALPVPEQKIKILKPKTKYILLWTDPKTYPFFYFGEGNKIFKEKNCKYVNCYVTRNRELLQDYTEFDIIAFNGPQLVYVLASNDLPKKRKYSQKYVYTNIESAANYPICSNVWDNFFNWTWTYKLNSDAIWGYIAVKNSSNHFIGPNVNINWLKLSDMSPIDEKLKHKLATKTKAAAWFVSNCHTLSNRESYVQILQSFLRILYLDIDIYGSCGNAQCPINLMARCLDHVEKHYYFYLAFENAESVDYVTEKVLNALNHFTVPIVFGGADYSRFLPPGSYLNAKELDPKQLADRMNEIMEFPGLYYDFFRWRNHYSFHRRHESPESDDYCGFCELANNDELMKKKSVYEHFSTWWTPQEICSSYSTNM